MPGIPVDVLGRDANRLLEGLLYLSALGYLFERQLKGLISSVSPSVSCVGSDRVSDRR